MNNKQPFYLRPWHFLLAIALFGAFTAMIAQRSVSELSTHPSNNRVLTELSELNLEDKGLTFLFFYQKESELCQRMKHNIEQLDLQNIQNIQFYAMDIEENPEYYCRYNLSGIPNILILDEGVEKGRVMGIVSTDNLGKIVHRVKTS